MWILVDVVLIAASLWLGYQLRFELQLGALQVFDKAPAGEYVRLWGLLAGTILLLCQSWGLFRLDHLRTGIEETAVVAKAVTVATGVVLAVTFFYRQFTFSRLTLAYFWVICILALSASQAAFRGWQLRRYRRGLDLRRAVVIGAPGYIAQRLMQEPAFGLEVLGFVAGGADTGPRVGALLESAAHGPRDVKDIPCLGSLAELGGILDASRVEQVVVVEQALTHLGLLETLDACEHRGIEVHLVPPIYDLLVQPQDLTYVQNVPLLRVDEHRFHRLGRLVKRAFDVVAAAILLVAFAPLLALAALWVRLGSPGPVLFVQVRAGEGGRPFRMFKLRTMVVDAEQRLGELVDLDRLVQPVYKLVRDPRVTRAGRWLRRFSLDELPQLWNVLKGDMSLVGPRPEALAVVDRYDIWQRRRLKVKPGITGLQQVRARGALSDLHERVRLDVYYVRKQSLLLDVSILLRTVWVVLSGKGAT